MCRGKSLRLSAFIIALAGLLILLFQTSLFAQTLLQELTKPPEGRSMRASSTFRKGADGRYDPQAEPLRLIINATCGPDSGKYQAALDGVKIGEPMDFYSAEVCNKEFPLLDFWPEPGTSTLRLECVGKNKLSDGVNLGVESLLLRERRPRVEKYGHDKDKDWRKQPLFYKG
jgi:hypothetical protein